MNFARIIAKKYGYELEKPKICELTLSAHLNKIIEHYSINLVIDVGANKGQFAKKLRKNGYQGIIHSVEPGTTAFANLSNASKNDVNWYSHKYALGAQATMVTLSVSDLDHMSTLYEFSKFGKEFGGEQANIVRKEQVEMITLDELVTNESISIEAHNCLLKIDTQGNDLEVLQGAQTTLSKFKAIQTELALKPIYDDIPSYEKVLEFCRQAGFSITGMYPVNRDKRSLELIEMDCVMVKV